MRERRAPGGEGSLLSGMTGEAGLDTVWDGEVLVLEITTGEVLVPDPDLGRDGEGGTLGGGGALTVRHEEAWRGLRTCELLVWPGTRMAGETEDLRGCSLGDTAAATLG